MDYNICNCCYGMGIVNEFSSRRICPVCGGIGYISGEILNPKTPEELSMAYEKHILLYIIKKFNYDFHKIDLLYSYLKKINKPLNVFDDEFKIIVKFLNNIDI